MSQERLTTTISQTGRLLAAAIVLSFASGCGLIHCDSCCSIWPIRRGSTCDSSADEQCSCVRSLEGAGYSETRWNTLEPAWDCEPVTVENFDYFRPDDGDSSKSRSGPLASPRQDDPGSAKKQTSFRIRS